MDGSRLYHSGSRELQEYSGYARRPEHEPPIPDWKRKPAYRDALSQRDLKALAEEANLDA